MYDGIQKVEYTNINQHTIWLVDGPRRIDTKRTKYCMTFEEAKLFLVEYHQDRISKIKSQLNNQNTKLREVLDIKQEEVDCG